MSTDASPPVDRPAAPRPTPRVWVTALAQILAGAECEWAHWFQTHHVLQSRTPPHPDQDMWVQRHQRIVDDLSRDLESAGIENLEQELPMQITFGEAGVLIGKADLVTTDVEGSVIDVYEAKGGRPRSSDLVQLQLYMWMMSETIDDPDDWVVRGRLVRQDEREDLDTLPEGFEDLVVSGFELLTGPEPLPRTPGSACRFCPITSVDCPDRVDE